MKEKILAKAKSLVLQSNSNITEIKLEEIMYGLEGLYLTFYKLFIILIISLCLKIFKEVIIFLMLYNVIRFFAFGAHAKNSLTCLISSSIIFIVFPLICKYVTFNGLFKIIISSLSLILILKYAPADTEKRPIISKKLRKKYKIVSTIVALIYILLSYYIKDNFMINSLLLSILTEAIIICPLTYKIFGVSYNNYEAYLKNSKV